MDPDPGPPRVEVSSPSGLLAVIPRLLGFVPEDSVVVLGTTAERGRVDLVLRYDLPASPDAELSADIADHAVSVLGREDPAVVVILVGYGPGSLVTPVADAVRARVAARGLELAAGLRVEGGRYWSYLCGDSSCCPADGVPFDPASHPAAAALTVAGLTALPGRAALAATIAPLAGPVAGTMREATRRAERTAVRLLNRHGVDALDRAGLAAVQQAITAYRGGGSLRPDARHAWLALVLIRLRIRDDAWARMDPGHRDAHRRLWTDVVRRARPGYVAAPACLLAFTAWQCGDGVLGNIALDRALADTPDYSMALLLRDALSGGAPPSAAVPLMTPEEVADSYADPGDSAERDAATPGD